MKAAIFDFNRTLWEDGAYLEGALDLLQSLKKKGVKLAVVSAVKEHEVPEREDLIKPIEPLFHSVNIVTGKSKDVFRNVAEDLSVPHSEVIVIGDKVNNEIKYGNQLGMTTIWLKRGKNAQDLPASKEVEPHHTVDSIKQLRELLNKY